MEFQLKQNKIEYMRVESAINDILELDFIFEEKSNQDARLTVEYSPDLNTYNQPPSSFTQHDRKEVMKIQEDKLISVDVQDGPFLYISLLSDSDITIKVDGVNKIAQDALDLELQIKKQEEDNRKEITRALIILILSLFVFLVVILLVCSLFSKKNTRNLNSVAPQNGRRGNNLNASSQNLVEQDSDRISPSHLRRYLRSLTPDFPTLDMKIFNHRFPFIMRDDLTRKQWENLDRCPICYSAMFLKEGEELPEGEELRPVRIVDECGHMFHEECLINWFEEDEICPCCRKFLDRRSLLNYEFNRIFRKTLRDKVCLESCYVKDQKGVVRKAYELKKTVKKKVKIVEEKSNDRWEEVGLDSQEMNKEEEKRDEEDHWDLDLMLDEISENPVPEEGNKVEEGAIFDIGEDPNFDILDE